MQPKGTSEGQFFQAARGFSTVSRSLLTHRAVLDLKSLKPKPKVAFRLSLINSLEKLCVYRRQAYAAKFQTAAMGLQSLKLQNQII